MREGLWKLSMSTQTIISIGLRKISYTSRKMFEELTCAESSWYGDPLSTLVVSAVDAAGILWVPGDKRSCQLECARGRSSN